MPQSVLRARRQVDNPSRDEGAAVIDADRDAMAGPLIADNYACPKGQRLVRRRDARVVIALAVCRTGSRRIGGGDTAFGERLLAANKPYRC